MSIIRGILISSCILVMVISCQNDTAKFDRNAETAKNTLQAKAADQVNDLGRKDSNTPSEHIKGSDDAIDTPTFASDNNGNDSNSESDATKDEIADKDSKDESEINDKESSDKNDSSFSGNDLLDENGDALVAKTGKIDNGEVIATQVSLGIGFEDWTDNDFNDIVLCFDGKFKVDMIEGVIVSLVDQKLPVFYKRLSGSSHKLFVYNGKTGNDLMFQVEGLGRGESGTRDIQFKKHQAFRVSMDNKVFMMDKKAKVESDTCRTTGN